MAGGPVDAGDPPVPKGHIFGLPEDGANRIRDVGWLEAGRGDLVEQRQEGVEVVLVDDRDPDIRAGETLGDLDPGEATADDDDLRRGCLHASLRVVHLLCLPIKPTSGSRRVRTRSR